MRNSIKIGDFHFEKTVFNGYGLTFFCFEFTTKKLWLAKLVGFIIREEHFNITTHHYKYIPPEENQCEIQTD